jgi:hypothetical protein
MIFFDVSKGRQNIEYMMQVSVVTVFVYSKSVVYSKSEYTIESVSVSVRPSGR